MAIESHQGKYQEKIRKDPDGEFNNVIDISWTLDSDTIYLLLPAFTTMAVFAWTTTI
jgi:hypothetical protein